MCGLQGSFIQTFLQETVAGLRFASLAASTRLAGLSETVRKPFSDRNC